MNILQPIMGFVFLIVVTLCFSEAKRSVNWRLIVASFILQNLLFLMIHYVPIVSHILTVLAEGLVALLNCAHVGAEFVLGDFASANKFGFVFALTVIPTLIFFGSVVGILYFFGIIQKIVAMLAYILRKTLRLSGVESFVIVGDIFLGQTEAPLLVGPYIKNMTRSELACVFIAGLANIAGSTAGMYLTFLAGADAHKMLIFANYLITAGFMNAVSAIIFAKILFPETDFDHISAQKIKSSSEMHHGFVDSVFQGATTGLKIGVSLFAAILTIVALVHLLDEVLFYIGNLIDVNGYIIASSGNVFHGLSLEYILGQIFRVFAFFMGIGWHETLNVGSLLGQKVAFNEFVAYISLGQMIKANVLSEHAIFISTFALASFSNFASIGISLSALSVLAPERRAELTGMAFKALFGAVLAGFMTATVAGFWHTILG